MPPLARRNLFHDKVRLTVTLTGIVFAVVLIVVELGLFVGFTEHYVRLGGSLRRRSLGDFETRALRRTGRAIQRTQAVSGARDRREWRRRKKYISRWTQWKRADGQQESVQIVGIDPDSTHGRPWNLVQGRGGGPEDARTRSSWTKFTNRNWASPTWAKLFEINGRRARMVGFTHGIRSFTTSPYVFTTFKNAQDFVDLREDQTNFHSGETRSGSERGAGAQREF